MTTKTWSPDAGLKFVKAGILGLGIAAQAAPLAGCGGDEDGAERAAEAETEAAPAVEETERSLRELVGATFASVPTEVDVDMDKVLLGRALYYDRRLSGDETVACATCHSMEHGGAEPRAVSIGIRGQRGPINAPTVLNAAYNFRQFWDGRAADLLEQAAGPVTNPIEMGGDWDVILERLRGDEETVAAFTAVYGEGEPVTQANVLDAIVEYERSLVTPSDFDRWLEGDDDALTEQEQRGLRTFVQTGCTGCHRGRNIGGDSYQLLGAVNDYFERRGGEQAEADRGRFNVTQGDDDLHRFKVPTLRNVEHTAPYFHDGHEPTLEGAVRTMGYVQLGQELTDAQVADIVAFLRALSGDLPAHASDRKSVV
jgi:cytochrome c peroxidase